jgi:hypothetical protein
MNFVVKADKFAITFHVNQENNERNSLQIIEI